MHANFRVWDEDAYAAMAQRREAGGSFRMGVVFAMIFVSYLFVWGFREAGSVWFSLSFTCFGIGVANLAGFWPEAFWIGPHFRVKTLLLLCSYWCVSCLLLHATNRTEALTIAAKRGCLVQRPKA